MNKQDITRILEEWEQDIPQIIDEIVGGYDAMGAEWIAERLKKRIKDLLETVSTQVRKEERERLKEKVDKMANYLNQRGIEEERDALFNRGYAYGQTEVYGRIKELLASLTPQVKEECECTENPMYCRIHSPICKCGCYVCIISGRHVKHKMPHSPSQPEGSGK